LHIYKVLNDGGTGTEDEFHHMGPLVELVAIWHYVDRTEGRNGNRLAAETGMLTAQKLGQAGHDAGKDNANDQVEDEEEIVEQGRLERIEIALRTSAWS
jgi:hypothetical protein